MKITEPKTPYVRYDAESDTVMDLDSAYSVSHESLTRLMQAHRVQRSQAFV